MNNFNADVTELVTKMAQAEFDTVVDYRNKQEKLITLMKENGYGDDVIDSVNKVMDIIVSDEYSHAHNFLGILTLLNSEYVSSFQEALEDMKSSGIDKVSK